MAQSTAALISALFPLGGLGAILSGWLMDRFNANLVVAACFALTAAGHLCRRAKHSATSAFSRS